MKARFSLLISGKIDFKKAYNGRKIKIFHNGK